MLNAEVLQQYYTGIVTVGLQSEINSTMRSMSTSIVAGFYTSIATVTGSGR